MIIGSDSTQNIERETHNQIKANQIILSTSNEENVIATAAPALAEQRPASTNDIGQAGRMYSSKRQSTEVSGGKTIWEWGNEVRLKKNFNIFKGNGPFIGGLTPSSLGPRPPLVIVNI